MNSLLHNTSISLQHFLRYKLLVITCCCFEVPDTEDDSNLESSLYVRKVFCIVEQAIIAYMVSQKECQIFQTIILLHKI